MVGGTDINIRLLVNLRRFIEEECISGLCSVERGGALTHKHFQMMVKKNLLVFRYRTRKSRFSLGGM